MPAQIQKCESFSELHQSESAWVIPNPWDAGSAKILQGLGFKALATTSSGFAYTLGRADGAETIADLNRPLQLTASAAEISKLFFNWD